MSFNPRALSLPLVLVTRMVVQGFLQRSRPSHWARSFWRQIPLLRNCTSSLYHFTTTLQFCYLGIHRPEARTCPDELSFPWFWNRHMAAENDLKTCLNHKNTNHATAWPGTTSDNPVIEHYHVLSNLYWLFSFRVEESTTLVVYRTVHALSPWHYN